MKKLSLLKKLLSVTGFWLVIFGVSGAFAGVPVISYTTPQVYTVGTAISPLSPTNTGGLIGTYGTGVTFAGVTTPSDVIVDASGNVYGLNNSSNTLSAFNSSGTSITTNYPGSGYNVPQGFVFDGLGNMYVSNYSGNTVSKITSAGVVTSISVNSPLGLAVDASNNVYVASGGTGNIYQIASGATSTTVFKSGFSSPWGVAIDGSGNLFVSQTSDNVIYKVASASTTHVSFATGFNSPRILVFDAAGNLTVADCFNNVIKKITPSGTITTVVSSSLALPTGEAYDSSGNLYVTNYSNANIVKFAGTYYSISPALPAGLSLNTYTGIITGTPTIASAPANYTVTAYGASGNGTTVINIGVTPLAPTATGGSSCGSGTITLTAGGGTPAGGTYKWYATSSGGTALQSSTSTTYSATYAATTTAYVSYTYGGLEGARTGVTATVNPIVSSPIAGASFAYPFNGNANDMSGNGNTGIPEPSVAAGPTLTTDRFGNASSAYSFNGSTQYITTTTQYVNMTSFTISLWFNTTVAGGRLIGYGTSQTGASTYYDRHLYMNDSGQLFFGLYNGGFELINTTASYNDGNWHHVVVSVGTTYGMRLFIDDVLQASNSAYTTPEVRTSYWRIGYDNLALWPSAPTNYYYTGKLDDISIYSTELTPAQITSSDNLNLIGTSSTVCTGNPITLTAPSISGASYSWTDGTTTVTGNPATFASASSGNYTLTVTGGPGGCSSTATVAPAAGQVFTWSAAGGSTDPTNAANWTYTTANAAGQGPTFNGTENIVVPTGLAYYPALTANEGIYSLTIASGAYLNLNGHTLSVGCNIYNSSTGQLLYGSNAASGITWNGTGSVQQYTGSSTTNTASIGNMTVNNSAAGTVTINSGPVDIYNTLTITKGNLVVASSPAALTLKSTATQTAYVAAIPTGFSITGTVAVERYVTGGSGYRGYRLMSSPVYNAAVSPNNVYSLNYLQNTAYLTGNAGGGFDKTGNPTVYLYREDQTPSNKTFTSGNFWGISAINNTPTYNYYLNGGTTAYNLPIGNGLMFFFRGNRASAVLATETTSSYVPVAATFSTSGTLNQGTIVVHSWYAPGGTGFINYSGTGTTGNYKVRGFNLVGNPYASSIDWSTFSNTTSTAAIYGLNVTPNIWTFDPKTKNYASYNALTNIATGNGGKIVASGQGFFVMATAASPSLTFQEAAKSTVQLTSGSTLLMSTQSTSASLTQSVYNTYLRLKMITDTDNYNDMVIGFNSTSSTKFNAQEDSRYVAGMSNLESIAAISSDSINAAAKWVPFPKNNVNQVIRLNVGAAASGEFTLQRTDLKEIPALYEVWLMDKYKKDSLDIKNNTTYIFDIDLNDTASFGSNRLAVVVRQNPALGVHLLDFTAVKATGGSQVVWKTENEYNYTNFTVQRSTDGGATFSVIDGVASCSQGTYSFLDKAPVKGANMYRLQITDLNGTISYSGIVTVMYGNTTNGLVKTGVVIYPNPAKTLLNVSVLTGFTTNSSLTAPDLQNYNVQIANILGMVVQTAVITGQNWQTDVTSLMPGTYVLQVLDKSTGKVVGQGSFIKL